MSNTQSAEHTTTEDEHEGRGRHGLHLRAMEWLCIVICVLLMAVTTVDVVGRYLFNAPVHGGYQLIAALMGLLFFSALPLVTAADEHIKAGLLDHLLTRYRERFQLPIVAVISAFALGGLAWRLFSLGSFYSISGASLPTLHIPLSFFGYFGAAMGAFSAAIAIWPAIRLFTR